MPDLDENQYKNITLNDIQLAAAYYPILIEIAKLKGRISYSDLVDKAKQMYPDKEYVQNAIAVSTGRKLDVVRAFTNERGLPDVSSLVVSKNDGECGSGFTKSFDPEKVRGEVYTFDWSNVNTDFDLYIEAEEKRIKPRKRIKKDVALKKMSLFYMENKNNFPPKIKEKRDFIVELLMEGLSEEEAFQEAVKEI